MESTTTRSDAPVIAVVLAAGSGVRFDQEHPKQLAMLAGKPVLMWSIDAFEHNEHVSDIIIVVNEQVRAAVEELADNAGYGKVKAIIIGGAERSDSTEAALQMLAEAGVPDNAKVLIHDSVRPFVSQTQIDGCVTALDEFNAASVACASTDTIFLTEDLGDREAIASVPERRQCFRAQTPQAFRFATIRKAYELAAHDPDFRPTDDTRVVVQYMPQEKVVVVAGSQMNMKVTTPQDMPVAELYAASIKTKQTLAQLAELIEQASESEVHARHGKA